MIDLDFGRGIEIVGEVAAETYLEAGSTLSWLEAGIVGRWIAWANSVEFPDGWIDLRRVLERTFLRRGLLSLD